MSGFDDILNEIYRQGGAQASVESISTGNKNQTNPPRVGFTLPDGSHASFQKTQNGWERVFD